MDSNEVEEGQESVNFDTSLDESIGGVDNDSAAENGGQDGSSVYVIVGVAIGGLCLLIIALGIIRRRNTTTMHVELQRTNTVTSDSFPSLQNSDHTTTTADSHPNILSASPPPPPVTLRPSRRKSRRRRSSATYKSLHCDYEEPIVIGENDRGSGNQSEITHHLPHMYEDLDEIKVKASSFRKPVLSASKNLYGNLPTTGYHRSPPEYEYAQSIGAAAALLPGGDAVHTTPEAVVFYEKASKPDTDHVYEVAPESPGIPTSLREGAMPISSVTYPADPHLDLSHEQQLQVDSAALYCAASASVADDSTLSCNLYEVPSAMVEEDGYAAVDAATDESCQTRPVYDSAKNMTLRQESSYEAKEDITSQLQNVLYDAADAPLAVQGTVQYQEACPVAAPSIYDTATSNGSGSQRLETAPVRDKVTNPTYKQ